MSAPPFLPCVLEGLTPAQAITEISAIRREHPRVPVIAVLPEGASRELAAVAAEHADVVFPHGGDFREVLAELGLPDTVTLLESRGIACARDAHVEAWLLEMIEPLSDESGVDPDNLIVCAVNAWNSTRGDESQGEEHMELMAIALAGDKADIPLQLMRHFAKAKRARFPNDTRTIVDHWVDDIGGQLIVTAVLAEIPEGEPARLGERDDDDARKRDAEFMADLIDKSPVLVFCMPLEAFRRDAEALNVEEDESRLPIRWLAAAQLAHRLADATDAERKQLVNTWVTQTRAAEDSDGVFTALAMPGIVVRDLASAGETLVAIATQARTGGALYLAYCIATNTRLALTARGPAGVRARATIQQAETLRAMGLAEQTRQTFEAALEDAIRAGDEPLAKSVSDVLASLPE